MGIHACIHLICVNTYFTPMFRGLFRDQVIISSMNSLPLFCLPHSSKCVLVTILYWRCSLMCILLFLCSKLDGNNLRHLPDGLFVNCPSLYKLWVYRVASLSFECVVYKKKRTKSGIKTLDFFFFNSRKIIMYNNIIINNILSSRPSGRDCIHSVYVCSAK